MTLLCALSPALLQGQSAAGNKLGLFAAAGRLVQPLMTGFVFKISDKLHASMGWCCKPDFQHRGPRALLLNMVCLHHQSWQNSGLLKV